jgi:hypothetical protein
MKKIKIGMAFMETLPRSTARRKFIKQAKKQGFVNGEHIIVEMRENVGEMTTIPTQVAYGFFEKVNG